VQFCHGQAHRERLEAILQTKIPERHGQWAEALRTGAGRFAEWRWKTLLRALDDLDKVEPCLRWCADNLTHWDTALVSRDAAGLRYLQQVCSRADTWDRAKAARALIQPLAAFMSWVQGCDCHEEALISGQLVSCPFKGCRAQTLWVRTQALRSELARLRAGAAPGTWSSVSSLDVVNAGLH